MEGIPSVSVGWLRYRVDTIEFRGQQLGDGWHNLGGRTMRWSFCLAAAAAIAFVSISEARAADNFTVSVTSNGSSSNLGFSSVESALNQLKNNQLNATLPNYTSTSIANAAINFRGLPVTVSYPTNGTALVFQIPSLGVNQTFQGTTRDDSQNQLIDFLKKNNIYGRILNSLAAVSPTEPLAGNPTSLMSRMVGRDFAVAFSGAGGGTTSQRGGEIGLGLAYGHFTQGGVAVDSITIPISYSYKFEADPRYVLTIDLPLDYNDSGGAAGAAATLGVSLSIPVTDAWTVTPKISTGAAGSVDLGSAGALIAGTVTSAYKFKAWGVDFVMGNMVGVVKSIPLSFGQYSFDPKLTNEFMKNGIMVSRPLSLLGVRTEFLQDAEAQVWIMDTRFTGSKLYDDSYQEAGFSIGKPISIIGGRYIRVGATLLHSHHSNGGTINMGYKF